MMQAINLLSDYSRVVIEFPPTGGVYPYANFYSVKLLRYQNIYDYVTLGFEMVFIILVFYYTIMVNRDIIKLRWSFFTRIWQIIDLIIILVSLSIDCGRRGINTKNTRTPNRKMPFLTYSMGSLR